MIPPIQTTAVEKFTDIGQRAAQILRRNDLGAWT